MRNIEGGIGPPYLSYVNNSNSRWNNNHAPHVSLAEWVEQEKIRTGYKHPLRILRKLKARAEAINSSTICIRRLRHLYLSQIKTTYIRDYRWINKKVAVALCKASKELNRDHQISLSSVYVPRETAKNKKKFTVLNHPWLYSDNFKVKQLNNKLNIHLYYPGMVSLNRGKTFYSLLLLHVVCKPSTITRLTNLIKHLSTYDIDTLLFIRRGNRSNHTKRIHNIFNINRRVDLLRQTISKEIHGYLSQRHFETKQ